MSGKNKKKLNNDALEIATQQWLDIALLVIRQKKRVSDTNKRKVITSEGLLKKRLEEGTYKRSAK